MYPDLGWETSFIYALYLLPTKLRKGKIITRGESNTIVQRRMCPKRRHAREREQGADDRDQRNEPRTKMHFTLVAVVQDSGNGEVLRSLMEGLSGKLFEIDLVQATSLCMLSLSDH